MLLSASLTARPSSVGPRHHAGDGRAEPIPWRLGGSNGSLQSGDAGGAGAGGGMECEWELMGKLEKLTTWMALDGPGWP